MDSSGGGQLSNDELALVWGFLDQYYEGTLVMLSITTAFVYDGILTLQREVELIWGQKLSGATIIYLLNRYVYLVIPLLALFSTARAQDDEPPLSCKRLLFANTAFSLLVYLSQAVFATLRIYAIWGSNVKIGLLVFMLHVTPLTFDELYTLIWLKPQAVPANAGCYTIRSSGLYITMILRRAALLVNDIVMLGLTWAKTYSIRREALSFQVNVPMSTLLLRDGTLHFGLFLTLSIIDIIQASMMSSTRSDWAGLYISLFRSVTVCHFILHLRQVYLHDAPNGSFGSSSILQFASQVVGNLGAPLDLGRRYDGDGGASARVSMAVSDNPLAVGLPLEEEQAGFLAHSSSPRSSVSLDDVFNDVEYGRQYISMMRRKNTGDEVPDTASDVHEPELRSLMASGEKEAESDDEEHNHT